FCHQEKIMAPEDRRVTRTLKAISRDEFFGPPPVLPGEDAAAYEELFAKICHGIKADTIEKILIEDVVNNSWEINRLRRLRVRLIEGGVEKQVASVLSPQMRRRKAEAVDWQLLATEGPSDKLARKRTAGDPDVIVRVKK